MRACDSWYRRTQHDKKQKQRREGILWRVNIIIKPIVMVYQLLKLRRELSPGNRVLVGIGRRGVLVRIPDHDARDRAIDGLKDSIYD